jgi:hypothetical protein
MDFLVSLLCGSSTGLLGSCLVLVRSFLARLHMGFLEGTYALNSLERSLKRTHANGNHALFLQVVLILPLVRIHPENVTRQISLREWNICQCHAGIVAWAVILAGQLHNVGIELLHALYELVYANPLGLLEHVGKVALLLLSCVVWKHSEKVKHDAAVKGLPQKFPWAFPSHALKILEWISLRLLLEYLVPRILGFRRQQICIELKHLGRSSFALVLGSLFHKVSLVVDGLVLIAKFWGWCIGQSRAFLGLLGILLLLRGFLCRSLLGSFLALASGSR